MKMLKPNSQKCLKQRDEFSYWSTLPLDLLIDVFNHFGYADFQRAKSVCSSWHSASKQSLPNNQIPWLILFPEEEDSNKNYCTFFNPEESKVYKTQDLGVGFTKSVCLATCGCWLFMRDQWSKLFILNLLTNERINLPTKVELLIGTVKIKLTINAMSSIRSSVLWIDENTKDYTVLWVCYRGCVYLRKGDQLWNQIPLNSYCIHMVYKDHKLYTFSNKHTLRILDFSGEVPQLIYTCTMSTAFRQYPDYVLPHQILETRIVVTLTGDVLRVNRVLDSIHSLWSFSVYKIYSSSSGVLMKRPERIVSLGDDEAIVLDLGITVSSSDLWGFRRNSIYFVPEYDVNKKILRANMNDAFLFNIQTEKMEKLDKFDCSSARRSNARWFLPNFKQT